MRKIRATGFGNFGTRKTNKTTFEQGKEKRRRKGKEVENGVGRDAVDPDDRRGVRGRCGGVLGTHILSLDRKSVV